MTSWTSDELSKIGAAEELQIVSLRRDATLSKPVTALVIRHGDNPDVRSWLGHTTAWFRSAQASHGGHVRAGGVGTNVIHGEADPNLNDQINAAYRTKYRRHAATYVEPMMSPGARSTTLKLVPGATSS